MEHLVQAKLTGIMDGEVSRWLADLDDDLYAKLAGVGLVAERESTQLGPWLEKFMAGYSKKPQSRRKMQLTVDKLLAFFDPATPFRKITPDQAADWRQSLANGNSEASVKVHCGNAKTIFNEAVRRGLVKESPFRFLKSGATSSANDRYVTPEEIEAVLTACPNHEWKLVFALARLAGLRTPSETHLLTWADVDWERSRLTVRSPKTERFDGQGQRMVPITPRLMQVLQDAFDAAPEGQQRLVTIRGGYLRRNAGDIVKRAGVEAWKDIFQTLRRSCEKEWAMVHPQYAVSKWIGHSITVSGKHYANSVPDELFDKAAQMDGTGAARNPARQPAETQEKEGKAKETFTPSNDGTPGNTEGSNTCDLSQNRGCGIRTRDLQTPSLTR